MSWYTNPYILGLTGYIILSYLLAIGFVQYLLWRHKDVALSIKPIAPIFIGYAPIMLPIGIIVAGWKWFKGEL